MRKFVRLASWTAIGQGFSSLSNLLLSVFIARDSSLAEFGAFGVSFSLYIISLGIVRAVVGDPTLLRSFDWRQRGPKELLENKIGFATAGLSIGIVLGSLLAIGGSIASGPLSPALLSMAAVIPGLILFDVMRYWAFAGGRPKLAALMDIIWFSAQLLAFVLLFTVQMTHPTLIVIAWGAAGYLPVIAVIIRHRWSFSIAKGLEWLRRNQDLSRTYLGEYATLSGAQQGVTFLTAMIAGLPASGSLRAGQTIMGPANIVTGSANAIVLPQGTRLVRHRPRDFIKFSVTVSLLLFAVVIFAGLLVWFVPDVIGEALLGVSWVTGQSVAMILAVSMSLNALTYSAMTGLRVIGHSSVNLRIRLIAAPVSLVLVAIGASFYGATGAVTGLAITALLQLFVWWVVFLRKWNGQKQ